MSFSKYLFESKKYSDTTISSIISKDIKYKVNIIDNNIFIKDVLVVKEFDQYQYDQLIQILIDYVTKNFGIDDLSTLAKSFRSVMDNITYIDYSSLEKYKRQYSNNSVICIVNEYSNYIFGVSGKSIQQAADYIKTNNYGYSLYVLDGAYSGIKIDINESITGWILGPGFQYISAIGATQVLIDDKLENLKHIRRK